MAVVTKTVIISHCPALISKAALLATLNSAQLDATPQAPREQLKTKGRYIPPWNGVSLHYSAGSSHCVSQSILLWAWACLHKPGCLSVSVGWHCMQTCGLVRASVKCHAWCHSLPHVQRFCSSIVCAGPVCLATALLIISLIKFGGGPVMTNFQWIALASIVLTGYPIARKAVFALKAKVGGNDTCA